MVFFLSRKTFARKQVKFKFHRNFIKILKESSFDDQILDKYCFKISVTGNQKQNISLSRNMEVIELTEKLEGEKWYYLTCFDFYNIQKDIIEIRNKGDKEFSSITVSVKIIDKGKPHDLKFGLNKNIDVISINEKNQSCTKSFEEAAFIRIKNGTIIWSECVQASLLLNTFVPTNIPMVVLREGMYVMGWAQM